jgi:hypothetical protein
LGAEVVYDIRDLVKVYPGQARPANRDITLQVYQGEILAGFTVVVFWLVGHKMNWRQR